MNEPNKLAVPTRNALGDLSVARRALAEADTLPELTHLMDQTEVVRIAARKIGLSLDAQNDWAEFKLDTERKAGSILRNMVKNPGTRASGAEPGKGGRIVGGNIVLPPTNIPRLADLGVDKMQASRWRAVAAIPEPTYRRFIDDARAERKEVTETGAIKLSRDIQIRTARAKKATPVSTPGFPTGPFRLIVIDPPWPMHKSERETAPKQGKDLDYPTMSLEQITELPIARLGKDPRGSQIYLWTTHHFLPDAFDLFKSWGVTYHCLITWVKPTGMTPYSWMFNTEHALFGYLGPFEVERKGLKVGFTAPTGRHSEKPDEFYDAVKQASPAIDGARLDMFARRKRPGWIPWGAEVSDA